MSNSLSDNVHGVNDLFQDINNNDIAAAKLQKRHIYYLINKDKINYLVRLQRARKSSEMAHFKDCSLSNNVYDVNANLQDNNDNSKVASKKENVTNAIRSIKTKSITMLGYKNQSLTKRLT